MEEENKSQDYLLKAKYQNSSASTLNQNPESSQEQ